MSGRSRDIINGAAQMSALGIDPMIYLTTTNNLEREIIIEIANRSLATRRVLDKNLANEIASAVSQIFKKS